MLRTGETFPAGPYDREVVLSSQEMLLLLVVAVPEVRIVFVSQMDAQTLFGITDRPADQRGQLVGSRK